MLRVGIPRHSNPESRGRSAATATTRDDTGSTHNAATPLRATAYPAPTRPIERRFLHETRRFM